MWQLAGEGELTQVGHPHRIEHAVQVIDLVLQDPREQPGRQHLAPSPPIAVPRPIGDAGIARHSAAQIRDGQAAFKGQLRRLAHGRELRVDQHVRDRGAALGPVLRARAPR